MGFDLTFATSKKNNDLKKLKEHVPIKLKNQITHDLSCGFFFAIITPNDSSQLSKSS